MQTFKREITTILTILSGSPWATHPDVQEVLKEYGHLAKAAWTLAPTRRVSLQIFHASRAIDSLLAHIASYEAAKPGRVAAIGYFNLGSSLAYIRNNTISGSSFTATTDGGLRALKDDRNKYLHRANIFPQDVDIRRFLSRTVLALMEASTFPT
jgi:hypothetical protein